MRILQLFIGIIIILYIFYFIGTNGIITTLENASILLIICAMCCYFLNNLIMAYRLKLVIEEIGQKIRFKFVFLSHMAGMLLSDVTPMRSGYVYTAYQLHQRNVPLRSGIAGITSTFLYDLLFKLGLAIIGLSLLYYTLFGEDILFVSVGVVIFLSFIILIYGILMYPPEWVHNLFHQREITKKALDLGAESKKIQRLLPTILLVSVVGWLLRGLEWFFLVLSIGIFSLSIIDCLFLNPTLTLLSMVPLTPAGLGLQEAGIASVMVALGVSLAMGVSFSLLLRITELSVDSIGLIYLLKRTDNSSLLDFYNSIDGDIDEQAYHSDLLVQRFFQRRKTSAIEEHLRLEKGQILLDIACGSGVQIREICRDKAGVAIGIDANINAVRYARSRSKSNEDFLIADASYLPFKNEAFNRIICAEIIEHLIDPGPTLSESYRILKENGRLVITTPNERSIWGVYELLWDLFGRGRNYGETHLKFYNRRDMNQLFSSFAGVNCMTYLCFSPFIALVGSERLLALWVRIDRILERIGMGVLLVVSGDKKVGQKDNHIMNHE